MATVIPLYAAPTFERAWARLVTDQSLSEQLIVCVEQLLADPWHPGLNTKKLQGVGELYSARVNDDYRLIFTLRPDQAAVLLHVDSHDSAHRWADRNHRNAARLRDRAREWSTLHSRRQTAIPLLRSDDPVAIGGTDELREMLEQGMARYFTHLDAGQRSLVELDASRRSGVLYVRGGAGTGKTAVAVHRAIHLARQGSLDEGRIIYLCFNRVLAETVRDLIGDVGGPDVAGRVDVTNFDRWVHGYLARRGHRHPPVDWDGATLRAAMEQELTKRPELREALGNLDPTLAFDEVFEMVRPYQFGSLAEYLDADRTGRGFGLRGEQRRAVWALHEAASPEATGHLAPDDLTRRALDELASDTERVPYRAVIVDEGQDCSPVMARLSLQLAGGHRNRLTVFADPPQAIYPRGYRGALAALAPRGRDVRTLRKPYRSTSEVLELARSLWDDDQEMTSEVGELHHSSRHGPRPVMHTRSGRAEVNAAVVERVRGQIGDRSLSEIAILTSTRARCRKLQRVLAAAGIEAEVVMRSSVVASGASVKIVTVHSAKGLDFPSVHLVDFHPVGREGQSARAELYVAVTRSSSDLDLYVDLTDFPEEMTWLTAERYDLDGGPI